MHAYRKHKSVTGHRNRRGYALMLVMVFVVLFTAVLGVAWRRVASALRIEHVCEVRRQCDAGSIQVLAQAMQVLETRLHCDSNGVAWLDVGVSGSPNYQSTYTCRSATTYNVSNNPIVPDYRWYIVTFTPDTNDGWQWSVSVVVAPPTEDFNSSSLPPLPSNPP